MLGTNDCCSKQRGPQSHCHGTGRTALVRISNQSVAELSTIWYNITCNKCSSRTFTGRCGRRCVSSGRARRARRSSNTVQRVRHRSGCTSCACTFKKQPLNDFRVTSCAMIVGAVNSIDCNSRMQTMNIDPSHKLVIISSKC